MATLTIEIDDDLETRLRAVAAADRVSAEDVFREALDRFLRARGLPGRGTASDRREALLGMIGLVKGGPTDASVHHGPRPGDGP